MSDHVVIADLTREPARFGLFVKQASVSRLVSDVTLPTRVVLQAGKDGSVRVLADEESVNITEDETTLIFEQPISKIPTIDDADLQTTLLAALASSLEARLAKSGQMPSSLPRDTYLILPFGFSLTLANTLRHRFSAESLMRFRGCVQEAAAFIMGFLREISVDPNRSDVLEGANTICLVAASDEHTIDVGCFDYIKTSSLNHRIVIQDFFQTTGDRLSSRLLECDWLGAATLLVIVEDPDLPARTRALVNAPLQALAADMPVTRYQIPAPYQLKLKGAAHFALAMSGHAPSDEYEVVQAMQIGIQTDRLHFYPILSKAEQLSSVYPQRAVQSFRLSGTPYNALRVNFCAGYSTTVEHAIQLGHAQLAVEDLTKLSPQNYVTASIQLDEPNRGEISVGVMPENRVFHRQAFELPGLVW